MGYLWLGLQCFLGIFKDGRQLVKCPPIQVANRRQIPHYTELKSCQMPGVCPGGGWAPLDLTRTLVSHILKLGKSLFLQKNRLEILWLQWVS